MVRRTMTNRVHRWHSQQVFFNQQIHYKVNRLHQPTSLGGPPTVSSENVHPKHQRSIRRRSVVAGCSQLQIHRMKPIWNPLHQWPISASNALLNQTKKIIKYIQISSGWWLGHPLWKIWLRQLGWLATQYMGKCQKWQPNHQPVINRTLYGLVVRQKVFHNLFIGTAAVELNGSVVGVFLGVPSSSWKHRRPIHGSSQKKYHEEIRRAFATQYDFWWATKTGHQNYSFL